MHQILIHFRRGIYATGRGDKLERISVPQLKRLKIVLEFPPVFISTAEAYKGVKPYRTKTSLKDALNEPVDKWKDLIVNDFEKSVFKKYPLIESYKKQLYDKGRDL